MKMDYRDRMNVWNETLRICASSRFGPPTPSFKVTATDLPPSVPSGLPLVVVENIDSIDAGRAMLREGVVNRPLVLVMADHRFAGGDVGSGSGAQEESIFRRTTLSTTLLQCDFYPIRDTEVVMSPSVTVFRDTEANGCRLLPLDDVFRLDFVACPGLHNPALLPDQSLTPSDDLILRTKIRAILHAATRCGNDGLVLGAMGCGAWRSPPAHVASIMKDELSKASGLKRITIACLEVDPKSYIVRDWARKSSNFEVFSSVFGR